MTKTPGLSASRAGLAGTRARLERLLVTAFAPRAAQPLISVLRVLGGTRETKSGSQNAAAGNKVER